VTHVVSLSKQTLASLAPYQGKTFDCQTDDPFLLTLDYQRKSFNVTHNNSFTFPFALSEEMQLGDLVTISAGAVNHRASEYSGEKKITIADLALGYVDIELKGLGPSDEYVVQQICRRQNKIVQLKNMTVLLSAPHVTQSHAKAESPSLRLWQKISKLLR
jgi:hypothetical protein